MNLETVKSAYEDYSSVNEDFLTKYPTISDFIKALEDVDTSEELVAGMYQDYSEVNKDFVKKYPTLRSLRVDISKAKYTDKEREDMRESALTDLRNLYKGPFEKLYMNREYIPAMLQSLKNQASVYGKATGVQAEEIDKKIANLEKAKELLDAYEAVSSVITDVEFDTIRQGIIPASEPTSFDTATLTPDEKVKYDSLTTEEQDNMRSNVSIPVSNKFLKQVMPTAEYKALELRGVAPTGKKLWLPEYSDRKGRGGDGWAQTWGATKDILRIPGRAVRPLAEIAWGSRSPGTTYAEEFARPDTYKTPQQEMGDEILGFQGVGGSALKTVGMQTARRLPLLAKATNNVFKFVDPALTVIRKTEPAIEKWGEVASNVVKSPWVRQGIGNVIRETPSMALDYAYESTRPDGNGNANLGLAGGVAGAFATPALKTLTGNAIERIGGKSALSREVLGGSATKLRDELQLAKILMDNEDVISRGGKKTLSSALGGLEENMSDMGAERLIKARNIDKAVGDEYDLLSKSPLGSGTPISITKPYEGQVGSDLLNATSDLQGNYLSSIESKVHRNKQDQVAEEIGRLSGIDLLDLENMKERMLYNPTSDKKALGELFDKVDATQGIGNKYKLLKEYESTLDPMYTAKSQLPTKPVKVEDAIETRTKIRKFGEGEGPYGVNKPMFSQAEEIQKEVMNDYLSKTPQGKEVLDLYGKMANNWDLQQKLPNLEDGKAVDSFLNKIGNARINMSSKANELDDFIKLQESINKITGRKDDFITPAVLRRVQSKTFWEDYLGAGNAGLINKALTIMGNKTVEAISGGKLRSLLSEVAKQAGDAGSATETKQRQKESTQRNVQGTVSELKKATSLFDEDEMKSIIADINKRKQADAAKMKLGGK